MCYGRSYHFLDVIIVVDVDVIMHVTFYDGCSYLDIERRKPTFTRTSPYKIARIGVKGGIYGCWSLYFFSITALRKPPLLADVVMVDVN